MWHLSNEILKYLYSDSTNFSLMQAVVLDRGAGGRGFAYCGGDVPTLPPLPLSPQTTPLTLETVLELRSDTHLALTAVLVSLGRMF